MAAMLNYLKIHFQSIASIGIRGASVVAGFLITFFIGHQFGPTANGQYALIAQTAMFLSIVAVGGMDMAVVRRFAAAAAYHVPLAPASLLRALGYSLSAGLILVLLVTLGGPHITSLMLKGQLPAYGTVILAMLLLARTTTRLTAAVLRSQDQHMVAQSIEVLVIPGMVALMLVLHVVSSLEGVLIATAAVGLSAAAFGIWKSWQLVEKSERALDVPFGALLQTSLPLWATAIALNIADWYSLATAATTLGVYEAGLFRVAFQIGGALSFSAMGAYNVFTARISGAVAMGDVYRVAKLGRAATRLALLLVTPVVIGLLLFGRLLLGFIGPEFETAAPLLMVTVIGQAIYVATGPAGLVLAMTGHERLNLLISASVTGALLIFAPIAANMFGLFGLAIATALVPAIGNLANLLAVHRLEKINVITGHYFGPPVELRLDLDDDDEDEGDPSLDGIATPD